LDYSGPLKKEEIKSETRCCEVSERRENKKRERDTWLWTRFALG
jgi:hypothetical protein